MRYLYNHALTATELYLGCDESICSKNIAWLRNNLDVYLVNRHAYFGHILTYTFDMIVDYILENKVRFVGPYNSFHIDVHMFNEDEFLKLRRKGKFHEIDVIESDFKGYQLAFYYNVYDKKTYKNQNIYLSGKHKNKLLERINSGDKMYSLKDINLDYFIPFVSDHFKIDQNEIKRILYVGFYKMVSSIKRGCYVCLDSKKLKSIFFVGGFYKNHIEQVKDYFFRSRLKFMKLYYWSKEPLNEYHYIGIDKKLLSNWCNANYVPHISRRKKVKFEKLYARKQLEVVLRNSTDIYIFKVKLIKSHIYKLNYFVENEWLNAEYIGRGINYKFHPENKHWKDLIKEIRKNEERNS